MILIIYCLFKGKDSAPEVTQVSDVKHISVDKQKLKKKKTLPNDPESTSDVMVLIKVTTFFISQDTCR